MSRIPWTQIAYDLLNTKEEVTGSMLYNEVGLDLDDGRINTAWTVLDRIARRHREEIEILYDGKRILYRALSTLNRPERY